MRVNSAFTAYFTQRLVARSGITIVMLSIFFTASSFTNRSDRDLRAKQVNLIIRKIGHRLLLQAGDSTSRVLPVKEIKEGTFLLTFENEFVFRHDSLMMLTRSMFLKTQFPSGFTVTVHECLSGSIVYGFQINNTSPDVLACRGRRQPSGCFTIEITFPDLYENVAQKQADINQLTNELKSSKVDPQQAIPIAIGTEEIKTTTIDNDFNSQPAKLKSFKVDPQEANPIPIAIGKEEVKTTTFTYSLINLVYCGILVLLGVTFLIWRLRKRLVPAPVQSQDHALLKESVPEVPALGKFLFDEKDQRLLLGSEVISLTDKEYRILDLLNKNFGELIPRETLMQKVWISEGVITGRSLDMFVSKLRKKLSGDPELRITNVHGKGYKLEIPGMQIL
jgi:DNA-binding winged helix-turn-helix (wHTH) protein